MQKKIYGKVGDNESRKWMLSPGEVGNIDPQDYLSPSSP